MRLASQMKGTTAVTHILVAHLALNTASSPRIGIRGDNEILRFLNGIESRNSNPNMYDRGNER
jgi:hypothetical protein